MADTRSEDLRTARTYLTGFGLALLLTAIPFALVSFELLNRTPALLAVAAAAVVQVLVHLRYFLHLDLVRTPRENLLTVGFAAILIIIMIGGSLWIMLDLHHRMM
jgi:cytochrome o ubiquinol oxidase operon protein cyoD